MPYPDQYDQEPVVKSCASWQSVELKYSTDSYKSFYK